MPEPESTKSAESAAAFAARSPMPSRLAGEAEFPPGTRVGEYTLQHRLGAGGMGEVYEARRDGREARYAIKVLGPTDDAREGRLLELAEHPLVVAIHDRGEFADAQGRRRHYIVMRLVKGARPLTRYADERRLGLDRRVQMVVEVCRALEAMHPKICHYDLKPGNILVGDDGLVQVSDLGLARLAVDLALTPTGGTPAYSSPEQMTLPVADLDHRADQYALAATLYELVSGRPPVVVRGDMTPLEIQEAKRQAPAALSRTVAEAEGGLDEIVGRALSFSRDDRFPDTRAFREALEGWLEARQGVGARVGEWLRVHRVASVALWTAMIALVATGVCSPVVGPIANRLGWERMAWLDRTITLTSLDHVVLVPMPTASYVERVAAEVGVGGVLASDFRTSRRLLGALCERLGGTARVVVLDLYFPREHEADEAFVRGITVARSRSTPVVIVSANPILDPSGRPSISARLWEAGVQWGFATIVPEAGERGVPLALSTESATLPSLTLAALAAWHAPSASARFALSPRDTIEVSFSPIDERRPEWPAPIEDRMEFLPSNVQPPTRASATADALWRRSDAIEAFLRIDLPTPEARESATLTLERVLTDDATLAMCRSKAVVVFNPDDVFSRSDEPIPKAYLHAAAIEAALSGRVLRLATWREHVPLMLAAGAFGGLIGLRLTRGSSRNRGSDGAGAPRTRSGWRSCGLACVVILALWAGMHFAAIGAARAFGTLFNPVPAAGTLLIGAVLSAVGWSLVRKVRVTRRAS